MLDVVAIAMVLVVPVLIWSVYLVRHKRNYSLHRRIQLALGGALLVAVCLFELDIRLYGWRELAEASAYYDSLVFPVLYIHLIFAVTTTLLWIYTIVTAVRGFANPPVPNKHSMHHKRVAKLATAGMLGTAVTGWTFYLLAFVA